MIAIQKKEQPSQNQMLSTIKKTNILLEDRFSSLSLSHSSLKFLLQAFHFTAFLGTNPQFP